MARVKERMILDPEIMIHSTDRTLIKDLVQTFGGITFQRLDGDFGWYANRTSVISKVASAMSHFNLLMTGRWSLLIPFVDETYLVFLAEMTSQKRR